MGVLDFYQGKIVLLTGTTGFVGKVTLEKFLRCVPNVGRLYILIRKKKGLNTMERFKKEVLGSRCFDRARKLNPNFDEVVNRIIRPIEGDLLKDGLGLSPEDQKELSENLQVIINCAASVDFNSRLDEAIEVNVFGTLRMFELAKSCQKLESFLHVSTAYVNADKRGVIQEDIYTMDQDPEKLVAELYKIPKDRLIKETPNILGGYPNTYTFTKSLCEKILKKKSGDMSLVILRPSIIGASWRDPYLGWLDTVTAASAVYLTAGLGVLKYLEADPKVISDQIPVDFVGDSMIVAAATYANSHKLTIVHATSSERNPVNGLEGLKMIARYWRAHPPEKRLAPCTVRVVNDPISVKFKKLSQTIPTAVYSKIAYTFGNANMKKNADKLNKVLMRTETVSGLFKHFASNEWVFITKRIDEMKKFCTEQELKEFQLDITDIDWKKYYQYFAWGIHHYILGEKVEHPTGDSERMDLLASLKPKTYFADLKWAFTNGYEFKPRSKAEMRSLVLESPKLKSVIQNLAANRKNKNISEEKYIQQLHTQANQLCESLMSTYSMPYIKAVAWMGNLVLRTMYEKIVVDENSLARLAQLDTRTNGPVVLLPSHRSLVDFILISYIFFAYKMKCPHIGAYEEFLSMAIIPRLIRAAGLFYMRRDKIENVELYNALLSEYLQNLMLEDSWLQLFIEGARSRSGKVLPPNYTLLNMVTDVYYDKKVPDVQLVPITISYDRVVEGDTFPFELLGEEKLQLSLGKFLMSYKKLTNNFGKVYVKFCEPISVKEYTKAFQQSTVVAQPNQVAVDPFNNVDERKKFVHGLGLDILRVFNDNLMIMPSSIIASILLMHRKGIVEEGLIKKVEWLIPEITKRGGKISTEFVHIVVKSGIFHLNNLLEKRKDIFHPSFSAKNDYKNIILLAYYRNMLSHLFFDESIIACSLAAFGYELAWKDGVTVERLWESTDFLQKLVGRECFTCRKLNKDNFEYLLSAMIQRETLSLTDGKVKVTKKGGELMSYLCSLLWPFIEGYWITAVYLFALRNRDKDTPFEKFASETQGFAETMYDERIIQFYEACSLDTIRNALNAYKEWGLISTSVKYDETLKGEVEMITIKVSEAQLKEIVDNTQKFMKNSLANTMEMPVDIARKSVLVDFPFMSKL